MFGDMQALYYLIEPGALIRLEWLTPSGWALLKAMLQHSNPSIDVPEVIIRTLCQVSDSDGT